MPAHDRPAVITITMQPKADAKKSVGEWQAKFNAHIICFPGFVSLEFLAPLGRKDAWTVVQRFSNIQAAESWRQSLAYKDLMQQLKMLAHNNMVDEVAGEEALEQNGVTEMFVANVAAEHEKDFHKWTSHIHQLEAQFEGFRGVYVQSPPDGHKGTWITLLQFDSTENLDLWLNSPERKQLLEESASFISSLQVNKFISPYSGWFTSIANEGPAAWKESMLVLLVLFPIVMLQQKYLLPHLHSWPTTMAMFFANVISVSLIAFPCMPIVSRLLHWWLVPRSHSRMAQEILGGLLILALYVLLIALFWK